MTGFEGVWTALITPFDSAGKLDLPAFERLVKLQINARVAGVIPCGTTGESPTLTREEWKTLVTTTIQICRSSQSSAQSSEGSSVRVLAGTGTNDTAETVSRSREACLLGAHGVLVVTPYYNKPMPAGLLAHYRLIADSLPSDQHSVMLYNVPGRTGMSLPPNVLAELAEHPRIRALKEATGNLSLLSEFRSKLSPQRRNHFALLSGDDPTYLGAFTSGAVGVVSVASNVIPRTFVRLQRLLEAGNHAAALALFEELYPLLRDLFLESNPIPVKFLMSELGLCNETLRLPLSPAGTPTREALRPWISKIKEWESHA